MAELNCPLCGSPVRVPKVEVNERYFCKKCHTPFFMNKSRELLIGEPPPVEEEVARLKQELQERMRRVPVGRIAAGLGALIVVCWGLYYLMGPTPRIEGPAEKAARALAADDLAYLKSIAASGTADDLVRWYEEVHSRLLRARENWHGRDEIAEVHVGQVDPAQGKGSVEVSVHPAAIGSTRDVSIADPAAATAAAATPFEVETVWVLDRWGHWRLDGHETYARARPTS